MTSTSPRATGAPHSARAVNSAVAQIVGDCVSPRHPSGVDAVARASRDGRVGADASRRIVCCFQCDLDIPHVCYEGSRVQRWGLGDEAIAVLEGAQRYGYMLPSAQQRAQQTANKKRRT